MNIAMEHVFPVSREQLWTVLLDPARLANCIPGCEKLEEVGPDSYAATLKVGVGAIQGTYAGKVEIAEKQFPAHYRLSVEGRSAPGFLRGLASVDLSERADGATRLSLNGEAQVGGLIASVGQRFLSGIARQMVEQLFTNIERELQVSPEGRG